MLKFFSSPLDPDEFVTKLKGFVDEEEIDSDNPTLFTGQRPVIGRFDSHRFKLQRRVGIHWMSGGNARPVVQAVSERLRHPQ